MPVDLLLGCSLESPSTSPAPQAHNRSLAFSSYHCTRRPGGSYFPSYMGLYWWPRLVYLGSRFSDDLPLCCGLGTGSGIISCSSCVIYSSQKTSMLGGAYITLLFVFTTDRCSCSWRTAYSLWKQTIGTGSPLLLNTGDASRSLKPSASLHL